MDDFNKILNYQPHNIPEQFVLDPDCAIKIFFSFHPLPETRENIKLLFRAWLRLLNVYAEPSDISAMLLFQEQLIEFVEISYIKGVKDGYLPKPANQPID